MVPEREGLLRVRWHSDSCGTEVELLAISVRCSGPVGQARFHIILNLNGPYKLLNPKPQQP